MEGLNLKVKALLFDAVKNRGMRKGEAILRWIDADKNGRRFSDITRFICEMNGRDYDLKQIRFVLESTNTKPHLAGGGGHQGTWITDVDPKHVLVIHGHLFLRYSWGFSSYGKIISQKSGPRVNRGYGCTWMVGSWKKYGLLEKHCKKTKGEDGQWHVTEKTAKRLDKDEKFVLTPQRHRR